MVYADGFQLDKLLAQSTMRDTTNEPQRPKEKGGFFVLYIKIDGPKKPKTARQKQQWTF